MGIGAEQKRATNWYEAVPRRGAALRYGVSAALVAAAAASGAELLTLAPDGPVAADVPEAVMVDLPALASPLPRSEAPEGPPQEAMPAAPEAPPPPPEPVVQTPVETPSPPEVPHPDAVLDRKVEAQPTPPPPPVATAAQEEAAPAGADAAKADAAEGETAAAAPDARVISAWQRAMVGRLETAKHRNPHHQRLSGTADVAFRIDRAGHLAAHAIKHSSGSGVLDAAALALVAEAAPFPAPPPGLGDAGLSFTVPIRFNPRR